MVTDEFSIPSISCEGCAKAIKAGLAPLHGISLIEVDVPGKRVTVTHTEAVSRERIAAELSDIGYGQED
jgi:copper chaperone